MARRTLVQGGAVLSMDPAVGDFRAADVLIEDGAIAAVGSSLAVDDAEVLDATGMVVMPGLVDPHRHYWYTAVRSLVFSMGWEEMVDIGWVKLGVTITADDLYSATRGGIADAINSGVTSSIDYMHAANSREHVDAAVRAHLESPLRAVFAHGPSITKKVAELRGQAPSYEDWSYAARLQEEIFRSDDRRDLALALSGPDTASTEENAYDIDAARKMGVPVTLHNGSREGLLTGGIRRLHDAGLLGPDLQFVHCVASFADEFAMLADAGSTASWSPQAEIAAGLGVPPTRRAMENGVAPAFGCDSIVASSGSLFDEARAGLFAERLTRAKERYAEYRPTERAADLGITARQALEAVTINAAKSIWLGDKVGSLTPGKRADIVMLRATDLNLAPLNDIVETVVASAHTGNVDTVLIDGEAVKRGGRLLCYDDRSVADDLVTTAERMFEAAGYAGRIPA